MIFQRQSEFESEQRAWLIRKRYILDQLQKVLNDHVLKDWEKATIMMRMAFIEKAHWYQIPADPDFENILYVIGRGTGKSWAAANQISFKAMMRPGVTMGVIAPSWALVERNCMEDKQSGIFGGNVIPEMCVKQYNSKTAELFLKNGTKIQGFSSETPEAIRGVNLGGTLWADELQNWLNEGQEALDNIEFAHRTQKDGNGNPLPGQFIYTCTPTPPTGPMLDLYKRGHDKREPKFLLVEKVSTHENAHNLSDRLQKTLLRYEGTFRGRTEIYAEIILSDINIFNAEWFPVYQEASLPTPAEVEFIVISMDTAAKTGPTNDFTGCTVWAVYQRKTPKWTKHPFAPGQMIPGWETKWAAINVSGWRERLPYPRLKEIALKEFDRWAKAMGVTRRDHRNKVRFLIEDASSGTALIQDFQAANMPVAVASRQNQDKFDFVNMQADIAKSGLLWMVAKKTPRGRSETELEPHCTMLMEELTKFNKKIAKAKKHTESEHDDLVDSMANLCQYLRVEGYAHKDSDLHFIEAESDAEWDEKVAKRPPARLESIY